MYQGLPLTSLVICDEIKADMRPPPLTSLLSTQVQHALLPALTSAVTTATSASGTSAAGASALAALEILSSPHLAVAVPKSDLSTTADSSVSQQPPFLRQAAAQRFLQAKAASSGVLLGSAVASLGNLASASSNSGTSVGSGRGVALSWQGWLADESESSAYEVILLHRRQPVISFVAGGSSVIGSASAVVVPTVDPTIARSALSAADSAITSDSIEDGISADGHGSDSDGPGSDDDDDSDGSSTESHPSPDTVAALIAAGRGLSGLAVHGHPSSQPFTLGSEWTETQMAACNGDDESDGGDSTSSGQHPQALLGGVSSSSSTSAPASGATHTAGLPFIPFYRTAEYHFRECVWLPAAETATATPAALPATVLLDVGRNIAVCLPPPPPAAASESYSGTTSYISMSGVHGVWQPFHTGRWMQA